MASAPAPGPTDKKLIRYGSPDSIEKLTSDAEKAESVIGIHGVSAILRKPPSVPHGQAEFDNVAQEFQVVQTGSNRSHYTVVLPKPITDNIVNLFNTLFKPTNISTS